MKIVHESKGKLIAVIGELDRGIFLPHAKYDDVCVFISTDGKAQNEPKSLQEVLLESKSRTPVYEGQPLSLVWAEKD